MSVRQEVGTRDKTVPWYAKELPPIEEPVRELLEQYSKIAPDDVDDHVYDIRERAWEVFPYPCIGEWRFLYLSKEPQYEAVLQRLKAGEKMLDVGCGMGQDIRSLVFRGVPPSNIYGMDRDAGFFDLGYELFRDRERIPQERFIAADIFDEAAQRSLAFLDDSFAIVHASAFFHLFDYEGQMTVARRCLAFLQKKPGVMIFGRQAGTVNAKEIKRSSGNIYRHNSESWKAFWADFGQRTGTEWDVWVETQNSPSWKVDGQNEDANSINTQRLAMRYAVTLTKIN